MYKKVIQIYMGFPGGSESKGSACNTEDPGSIPGLGRSSGEGNGNPLQYSCLENSMDKSSLAGYSPQGHKESDMTAHIHTHTHTHTHTFLCHFLCMNGYSWMSH